jgi:hypothetical protein
VRKSDDHSAGPGAIDPIGSEPPKTPVAVKAGLNRARMLAVIAGVLAGLASFQIGEALYKIVPPEQVAQRSIISSVPVMTPSMDTQIVATSKNAALAFGALGLCLGGLLGFAGGLARGSLGAAAAGGVVGMTCCAILGGAVSLALLPSALHVQYAHNVNDLMISLTIHGLIWGLVGAGAGLAFAIGLGERRLVLHAVLDGLVGAVIGAVAFDILGATFFINDWTVEPISETWQTRLLARLLVTIGTASALALFLPGPSQTAEKQPGATA